MNIQEAIKKAEKIKACQEWRNLKKKWDGKIPRRGTKKFLEYKQDIEAAEEAISNL